MNVESPIEKPNVNIFFVNSSQLVERFDAQYYKQIFDFTNYIKLSKIAKVKGGKRIPLGYTYSEEPTPFLYLRVADITNHDYINYNELKCISEDVYQFISRYEINESELAISIAGTIGKIHLVKNIPQSKTIILTENCAKVTLKDRSAVTAQYLEIVLGLPVVQRQFELNYIQTTIPKLGLDRINNLFIPKIPSIDRQNAIVNFYHKYLRIKEQKNTEAQKLLDSIDEYLLNELGISLTKHSNDLDNRIFISKFSNVVGDRLDPFYFKYFDSESSSYNYDEVALKFIALIGKGQSITSDKVDVGQYPVIAGGQTSPYNHNQYNQEENVITVSASGAYAGYVWFHTQKIFASDCSVIRSKNEDEISTEFIYNVLKAKQAEIYRMQQGAGQPHVYGRDLAKIKIPVPLPQKQNEINEMIRELKTRANMLQNEGHKLLEDAKSKVEEIILGTINN